MKIFWLGHGSFRIELGDQVLLLDPWLTGNPAFPDDQRDAATAGTTAILLTHGHGDHIGDVVEIAQTQNVPVATMNEMAGLLAAKRGLDTIGFNKGGTIRLGNVAVSMVNAVHSSSIDLDGETLVAGSEAGFMIGGEGHMIYASGDTDIMADMEWFADYYKPDIGILCAGGHYTMDMAKAAYAAKRYFDFRTVIPCHFGTFPLLEQSAQPLIDALPGVNVIDPKVMRPISI